jgi:hypothetical protein
MTDDELMGFVPAAALSVLGLRYGVGLSGWVVLLILVGAVAVLAATAAVVAAVRHPVSQTLTHLDRD